jgi:hypothetical protein
LLIVIGFVIVIKIAMFIWLRLREGVGTSKIRKGQNVKSILKDDHNVKRSERQKSECRKEHRKSKMTFDILILPMASKKIRTSKIKKSTTYGVLPIFTKACGG